MGNFTPLCHVDEVTALYYFFLQNKLLFYPILFLKTTRQPD